MSVKLAFNKVEQFSDGTGIPYSGARLFTYVGGSVNTKQTTYTESTGVTPNTNPIVLDSSGRLPQPVWLTTGVFYKFVLAPSTDTDPPASPIWTLDNIAGINDTSISQSEWLSGPTPTFVSATQFTLAGDQTTNFAKSRRIKATVTAGTVYGTITNTAFAALTTVTLALDSGNLDSGLSAVSYGIVAPVNPSISSDEIYRKGTAVASAATTDIWGIVGDYVHVTGVVGITSFGTAPYAGDRREVIFDGILTITHNATTLQLPGGLPITTAAGDRAFVRADTTANMIVTDFVHASGVPVVGAQTANTVFSGPVSGAAAAPTFRALTIADGAAYAWVSSATVSNAATLDVFWTAAQASAVDVIEIEFVGIVPATNNQGTLLRFSTDGVTFDAGAAYQWNNQYQQSNPAANTNAGSGGLVTSIQVIQQTSNAAASTGSGTAFLFQPSNAALTKLITGKVVSVTSGNGVQDGTFGGEYTTTTALRGIRLLMGAGNITGTIYTKGRLKA